MHQDPEFAGTRVRRRARSSATTIEATGACSAIGSTPAATLRRPERMQLGDAVVVGLARGGVTVAAEVARRLSLPLDALAVSQDRLPVSARVRDRGGRAGRRRRLPRAPPKGLAEADLRRVIELAQEKADSARSSPPRAPSTARAPRQDGGARRRRARDRRHDGGRGAGLGVAGPHASSSRFPSARPRAPERSAVRRTRWCAPTRSGASVQSASGTTSSHRSRTPR